MQDHGAEISRLGIPDYEWWKEGLHGVARSGHAKVFPQAIGMAVTLDANLIHHEPDIVSTESPREICSQQQNMKGFRRRSMSMAGYICPDDWTIEKSKANKESRGNGFLFQYV